MSSTEPRGENRVGDRYTKSIPCELRFSGRTGRLRRRIERTIEVTIYEISVSGAALETTDEAALQLHPGQAVYLIMEPAEGPCVVRSVRPTDTGVMIGTEILGDANVLRPVFHEEVARSRKGSHYLEERWERAT